jgi:hypothetical protein
LADLLSFYNTDNKIIQHHYYPQLNSAFLRAGLDRGVELMQQSMPGGSIGRWLFQKP